MKWHRPYRWMQLWHPESPGVRVVVRVKWPRYLWLKDPDWYQMPRGFATRREVLDAYRLQQRTRPR